MAVTEKTDNTKCWQRRGTTWTLLHCCWKWKWNNHFGESSGNFLQNQTYTCPRTQKFTPRYSLKKNQNICAHKGLYASTQSSLIVVNPENSPDDTQQECMHTARGGPTVKKELLTHTTLRNFKHIVLVKEAPKKYCMISIIRSPKTIHIKVRLKKSEEWWALELREQGGNNREGAWRNRLDWGQVVHSDRTLDYMHATKAPRMVHFKSAFLKRNKAIVNSSK